MFGILNKQQKAQKIITEIHESFDQAGFKVINEANKILNESYYNELRNKKNLLNSCGFNLSKVSNEVEVMEKKIDSCQKIQDYSAKFNGLYKVITLDDVLTITAKYKLCLARTNDYEEEVPIKNLKEIKKFIDAYEISKGGYSSNYSKDQMVICAPENEFGKKTAFFAKHGRLIEIKDPIVLYPCEGRLSTTEAAYYNNYTSSLGNRFFYVVTKWGLEASDELVVNHKLEN